MKLTLQHFGIRWTNAVDAWIENQIFSLQPKLVIDEAVVRLTHRPEASPAFHVSVHLVTPGPDLLAESHDHTLRAAIIKVMRRLSTKIATRLRRRSHRFKTNTCAPAQHARPSRSLQNHN